MSDTLKRPNGGTPPQGPVQGASSGFLASVWLEAISESGLVGFDAQAHKASTAAIGARRTTMRIMSLPTKTSSDWGFHNTLSLHDLPSPASERLTPRPAARYVGGACASTTTPSSSLHSQCPGEKVIPPKVTGTSTSPVPAFPLLFGMEPNALTAKSSLSSTLTSRTAP